MRAVASGDGGGDLDVDVVIRSLDVLARCVSYTPRITNEILERTSNHELSKVDTLKLSTLMGSSASNPIDPLAAVHVQPVTHDRLADLGTA